MATQKHGGLQVDSNAVERIVLWVGEQITYFALWGSLDYAPPDPHDALSPHLSPAYNA
jgi:hypothetical protein